MQEKRFHNWYVYRVFCLSAIAKPTPIRETDLSDSSNIAHLEQHRARQDDSNRIRISKGDRQRRRRRLRFGVECGSDGGLGFCDELGRDGRCCCRGRFRRGGARRWTGGSAVIGDTGCPFFLFFMIYRQNHETPFSREKLYTPRRRHVGRDDDRSLFRGCMLFTRFKGIIDQALDEMVR